MSGTLKIAGTTLATNPTNSKVEIDDAVNGKGICKAWVNFDGDTSPYNMRDAFNITGITRVQSGVYDINFASNLFNNTNYCVVGQCKEGGQGYIVGTLTQNTNNCRITITQASTNQPDLDLISVVFFGS